MAPLKERLGCGAAVGADAFGVPAAAEAGDYTYTTMGGGIEITGYTGPGGDVTIPDFIDGMPIVSIGYQAFYGNNNLTSVTISTFVTSIGEQAFYASSLISVWIGPVSAASGHGRSSPPAF